MKQCVFQVYESPKLRIVKLLLIIRKKKQKTKNDKRYKIQTEFNRNTATDTPYRRSVASDFTVWLSRQDTKLFSFFFLFSKAPGGLFLLPPLLELLSCFFSLRGAAAIYREKRVLILPPALALARWFLLSWAFTCYTVGSWFLDSAHHTQPDSTQLYFCTYNALYIYICIFIVYQK